jgi:mono/diheme cytochrome c family protein
MSTARAVVLATVAALVFAACWGARAQTAAPAQKSDAPAGNAQNGKKLFTSYGCFECHGNHAEGTTAVGPRLAPNPIPFAALQRYVRQPTGQMPPYTSKVVTDADLADIYAYLQSLPQPPKADGIPALK